MGFFFLEIQSCAAVTQPLLRGCSQIPKAQTQAGIPNDPPRLCAGNQAGAGGDTEGRGDTESQGGTESQARGGTDSWG